LRNVDVDVRIILKWILEKFSVEVWNGFIWLMLGSRDVLCEYDNGHSGSLKSGKFLDQETDCQLLKKDYAVWSQTV
jgi:hypothetical protein